MAHATFYTVHGPRGEYYAVHNHDTEKIWTERTELAARQQAYDEGLEFVASENIDHVHLLDKMIAVPYTSPEHGTATHSGHLSFKVEGGLSRFFRRLRGQDNTAPRNESK